ncbi:MAG: hypothetical protein E6J87_00765 [Deltaproteobacteria bacterium]|nr:MAG: hypothetical protein E6J87_00765 [Deltaproteobacteria bacterium]
MGAPIRLTAHAAPLDRRRCSLADTRRGPRAARRRRHRARGDPALRPHRRAHARERGRGRHLRSIEPGRLPERPARRGHVPAPVLRHQPREPGQLHHDGEWPAAELVDDLGLPRPLALQLRADGDGRESAHGSRPPRRSARRRRTFVGRLHGHGPAHPAGRLLPRALHTSRGSYPGSPSPSGTFDQGGNVWEWTETAAAAGARGLRGGGFGSNASMLAASFADAAPPAAVDDAVGFRVAPEPDGNWMPFAGALAVFACAKRRW